MPSQSALVILAEFAPDGTLVPDLAGRVVHPSEGRKLGLAMLRDCVEKAHHCAGFDPIVAYYPPDRRGEVEDAIASRDVWAEPTSGASRGARAETFLRHLIEERTYRQVVTLSPLFPHIARERIFAVVHALRLRAAFAVGVAPDGTVGIVGVQEAVPQGALAILDRGASEAALAGHALAMGREAARVELPAAVQTEDELAQTVFDLRAAMATAAIAGDDLPLHTFEVFDSLGLEAALRGDGSVELRRLGPPRRRR